MIKTFFWILISFPFFAGAPQATECNFQLMDFLKREIVSGKDFESIRQRIERGELKLVRIPGQSVSEVVGLPPSQGVFVRSDFTTNLAQDRGLSTVGIDVTTRQKRDVQFYRISRHLGFDSVPETKLMNLSGKEVSMQARVYGKEFKTEKEYERFIKKRILNGDLPYMNHKQDIENLATLDMVAGNLDRNITNIVFDEASNRVYGIDHADSMPEIEKVPSVIWFWNFNGVVTQEKMTAQTFQRIMNLDAEKLGKLIQNDGLLNQDAVYRMKGRIKFMKRYLLEHPDASIQELGNAMEDKLIDF